MLGRKLNHAADNQGKRQGQKRHAVGRPASSGQTRNQRPQQSLEARLEVVDRRHCADYVIRLGQAQLVKAVINQRAGTSPHCPQTNGRAGSPLRAARQSSPTSSSHLVSFSRENIDKISLTSRSSTLRLTS